MGIKTQSMPFGSLSRATLDEAKILCIKKTCGVIMSYMNTTVNRTTLFYDMFSYGEDILFMVQARRVGRFGSRND